MYSILIQPKTKMASFIYLALSSNEYKLISGVCLDFIWHTHDFIEIDFKCKPL